MNANEVKQNLNKIVYYKLPNSDKLTPFIFNAYIYRVNPKNRKERVHQAELLDTKNSDCNNGSTIIARLDDVILNSTK